MTLNQVVQRLDIQRSASRFIFNAGAEKSYQPAISLFPSQERM